MFADQEGGWASAAVLTGLLVHPPTFAHPGGVSAIAISPVGRTMATGGRDGLVKVWDLETGTELVTLTGATQPINSLTFSSDGSLLASGSTDDVVRVYTLDVGVLIEIGRSKVTRGFTDAECRQYLHTDGCDE